MRSLDLASLTSYVSGNCKDIQSSILQHCIAAAHRYCEQKVNERGGLIQDVTSTNASRIACVDFATYGAVRLLP